MSHAFLPNVGSSRVENIKKRFEANTSSSGSENVSPRTSPERCRPSPAIKLDQNNSSNEALKPLAKKTSPAIRNTISDLSESSIKLHGKTRQTSPARFPIKYDRQLSSSSARGSNVKRSPAFRCDKMVKGRNVVGNSRLSGERPKSYADECLHFRGNADKPFTKPPEQVLSARITPEKQSYKPRPVTSDELATVFSQRNLKANIKSNITILNGKPELLQKPQLNAVQSPKVERLSPSRPVNNNRPHSLHPTKPNPSTNRPRPVEYAVVDKSNKCSEGKPRPNLVNSNNCDSGGPSGIFRSNLNKKSLPNTHSKGVTPKTEQSPTKNALQTKDLLSLTCAQNSEPTFVPCTQNTEGTRDMCISDRINAVNECPQLNRNQEDGVDVLNRDVSRLQLTNTLKKALSSPLPEGPPPKKPPRTFAHLALGTPKPSDEINLRIQQAKDNSSQVAAGGPPVVALKNDLTKKSKFNVNVAQQQTNCTFGTSQSVYGKARKQNFDSTVRNANISKNNSAQNNSSNLSAPNDMNSIRNVFPTRKSTENLSVPFRFNHNVLGTKRVNLESTPPESRDRTFAKPLRSKTESEIMLRKLENVLQNHQNSGVILRSKSPMSPRRMVDKATGPRSQNFDVTKNLGYAPVRPLPQVPKNQRIVPSQNPETGAGTGTLLGGCLESISCVGVDPLYARTSNFYEKLNGKNSEFFVTGYTDLASNQPSMQAESRNSLYGRMKKSSSVEHIYAEPFEFLRKNSGTKTSHSLETRPRFSGNKVPVLAVTSDKIVEIGHYRNTSLPLQNVNVLSPVCETSSNLSVEQKKQADALHYLCTPINPDTTSMDNGTRTSDVETAHADAREVMGTDGNVNQLRLADLGGGGQASVASQPLNQNKIHHLLNQAFNLATLPLDNADSDPPSSPDDPGSLGSEPGGRMEVDLRTNGDAEPDREMTERRKRYLTRHSSMAILKKSQDFPHLFQHLLLVGLTMYQENKVCKPYIKWKYPPDAVVAPFIEYLCFPDASEWPRTSIGEQSYSLVITNESGDRTFGYCRRVMPEGMDVCLPLAYCIISPVRATGFYYKVLSELEAMHGQPEAALTAFVSELYNTQVPGPGQVLKPAISVTGATREGVRHNRMILRRPLDLRLEEHDLTQLFSSLCISSLLQVFGSLLLERRVILFSGSLGKLSSCVEALQSILYPFSWQHTFIPVLPSSQLELCDAPTPYVFGILKGKDGQPPKLSITDGIMVDLEANAFLARVGDESTILPTRLRHSLKVALQLVSATTANSDSARNVLISEAFIRMFVEVCGHYQQHITTRSDGKKVFEREAFVFAGQEPTVQQFLDWFTMTAMFNVFVDARLESGPKSWGMFEQRVAEHSDEVHKNTLLYLKNSRLINSKLRTLGNRFKKEFSSSKTPSSPTNVHT